VGQDDLSGAVLDGRYQVIAPIAEGAMGSVYHGERLKLGRAVAIKIMHDALPDEMASRQRFDREAKLMARLEHPNCVSVIDFGVHDDKPFLVMELVRGTSLLQVLEKEGRIAPARAAGMMRQVLSGLAHAHQLGIVHRDIKPANIMVTEQAGLGEQVRILDFGLARLTEGSTKLTRGIVVGTPNYMAPEQCRGGELDGRTDLYACGVVLFEMLTGRKPFQADDPIGVVRKHLNQPAPKLADFAPEVPLVAFEGICARALAKDPKERFESAVEMSAALEEAVGRWRAATAAPAARAFASSDANAAGSEQATPSGWNVPAEPVGSSAILAVAVAPAPGTQMIGSSAIVAVREAPPELIGSSAIIPATDSAV
jgi:serine/threonine-protein kinase